MNKFVDTQEIAYELVKAFQCIYDIKHVLNHTPVEDLEMITHCGDVLENKMNDAFQYSKDGDFKSHISEILLFIKKLSESEILKSYDSKRADLQLLLLNLKSILENLQSNCSINNV